MSKSLHRLFDGLVVTAMGEHHRICKLSLHDIRTQTSCKYYLTLFSTACSSPSASTIGVVMHALRISFAAAAGRTRNVPKFASIVFHTGSN